MICRNETVYRTNENLYRILEQKESSPHHRRCINGQITGCGKCVGYCSYNGHPGYLTNKLRKEHNCIKKKCFYYVAKNKEPYEGVNLLSEALALVM